MRPALLLVDLQHDYLGAEALRPPSTELVDSAATLLAGCRSLDLPVLHAWTTIREDGDRMPHWKRQGKRACVEGTHGHSPPEALRPLDHEEVFHKHFFDPFGDRRLEATLRRLEADTLIVAGVYLHACIRAAALGAYERGLEAWVVEDAVGSDEPVHAAETRRWLSGRVATFLPSALVLERLEGAVVG